MELLRKHFFEFSEVIYNTPSRVVICPLQQVGLCLSAISHVDFGAYQFIIFPETGDITKSQKESKKSYISLPIQHRSYTGYESTAR